MESIGHIAVWLANLSSSIHRLSHHMPHVPMVVVMQEKSHRGTPHHTITCHGSIADMTASTTTTTTTTTTGGSALQVVILPSHHHHRITLFHPIYPYDGHEGVEWLLVASGGGVCVMMTIPMIGKKKVSKRGFIGFTLPFDCHYCMESMYGVSLCDGSN